MKKILSLILVLVCVVSAFCGCGQKNNEESKEKTETQPEKKSVTVTLDNGSDTKTDEENAQPAEPEEPLNKAMEAEGIAFEGNQYGVIINNAVADDIKAAKIDNYDEGNGSDVIAVIPYYNGSKIRIETVVYDIETGGMVPTETLYETTATDDYALLLKVKRPSGAMPEKRITVEYNGQVYSNFIKNVPDAETEYIR